MRQRQNFAKYSQRFTRLVYLLSQYPAINHAFMLREVQQLRALGFEIRCASVREPDRDDALLSPEEVHEKQHTFYIKVQPVSAVLRAHLRTLFSWPSRYLRAALKALHMGRDGPQAIIRALLYFAEAVVVGDWMRDLSIEHVHTHYASNVALIVTRIFPITMSATFHGPDEFKDPSAFHLAEKVVASRFVSAISNYGRSQMMLSCDYSQWKKLEITRLGVDTHSLLPEEFREHPEPLQLLCAGRLAAVKGQHVLLDAVRLLKEQCCPVHLHLAGDGEDRAALQNHVIATDLCDSVTFHGFLNQEKLRKLYAATDLFVLPSFAEGVPVVLMEAMALGIPCVATWVNGIPELIRNGIDGLTVAPGDAVGLANAIISCINDPRLRRQLSNAARLRATEIADLNRNVQHLAAIFAGYLRDDDAPEVAPDAADRQSAATAEYDKESVAELRR